ncbi:alpha-glucan family phosphorylase [Adhaeribacter pallidiroseus]|uniref:Glycogen phosphorylase n=1 Tax=Adhaeribacter pallidiroseus TaxID=2072847 RepID=A0A369QE81_9BACT|nr:alpha-glucan family phosphorylase [Adhaeribacter pallidiroseus]RDC63233.1 Glycogen phosphorylase [Adhaeribacter pallidiroseus]
MTFSELQPALTYNKAYQTRVAYFSMEFAIHQPLKIYSGGLGFLAGSHMRSAHELQQNLIGIGILWKFGYYDQIRKADQSMNVLFQEKLYYFVKDTGLRFQIDINNSPVTVAAYYLAPEVFDTVPMFFLSTDLPENDYLARTTSYYLYNADTAGKVGASILLGVGGAKLLDLLEYNPDIYHFNEAHPLPAAFYLYSKFKNLAEVQKRVVFTTHTPEEAGNEKTDINLLNKMSYFCGTPLEEVRQITGEWGEIFNHTLVALRMAKIANGVSKMHGEVARQMWNAYPDICPILHVTNAQNYNYWADSRLYQALKANDDEALLKRKRRLKKHLFEEVANQVGDIYKEKVLTIVWARRFAGYKRADLLLRDVARFERLVTNTQYPVQIIWAGKPYPMDYGAIGTFDRLVQESKKFPNCAVMVGHELKLSKLLKGGADVWLNNPRIRKEASGTSGMTAAMNGALNFSIQDGWIPEFARHEHNCFVAPVAEGNLTEFEMDEFDHSNMMDLLENVILPMYYDQPEKWLQMVKNSMTEIIPVFESGRMADEYYQKIYNA